MAICGHSYDYYQGKRPTFRFLPTVKLGRSTRPNHSRVKVAVGSVDPSISCSSIKDGVMLTVTVISENVYKNELFQNKFVTDL